MDAIKRVISGEDMHPESSSPGAMMVHCTSSGALGMDIDEGEEHDNNNTTTAGRLAGMANLVENDVEMDAPATASAAYQLASAFSSTPRSSLSDISAAQRLAEEEEEMDLNDAAVEEHSTHKKKLPRSMTRMQPDQQGMQNIMMDGQMNTDQNSDESSSVGKPGGSQTSSRDWGWFEDVHASDGALAAKEGTGSSPPDSSSGARAKSQKAGTSSTSNANNNKRKITSNSSPSGLVHSQESLLLQNETLEPLVQRDPQTDAAAMAVTAPNYVLEESLSSQRLWKDTAGQRPPQPVEERAFFEKMWAQNFARSEVDYRMPVEVLTSPTPISLNPFADVNFDNSHAHELSNYNLEDATSNNESSHHHHSGGGGGMGGSGSKKQHPSDIAEAALIRKLNDPARMTILDDEGVGRHQQVKNDGGDTLTIMVKGDNVFGTTVSKSFVRPSHNGGPIKGVDTVNISVASYRVVESKKHGKYAQYLVIYREGSIRDTIGVWKRYSDFQELSRKVTQAHEGCVAVIANMSPLAIAEEHEVEHLPNAITSWRLLKKRQRWYRCLDSGYLSLKVFLLERFLHDILFESTSPDLLRDFVGVPQPQA